MRIAAAAVLAAMATFLPMAAPAGAEASVAPSVWAAAGATAVPPRHVAPISLRDVAGKVTTLQHFRGRLVMLYFWATW